MIPAVVQTLTNILAGGTSLGSLEQISLNLPTTPQNMERGLSLYFYDIGKVGTKQTDKQADKHKSDLEAQAKEAVIWIELSFLVTAYDRTALGAQQLLSEALTLVLQHPLLEEDLLAPVLRGYGNLLLNVNQLTDIAGLWTALNVPMRPAFSISVTVPWSVSSPAYKLTTGNIK